MIDTKAIFEEAHTHNGWQDKPVPDDLLRRVYDAAKMGPTSSNCCSMRVLFVKSAESKARLKPTLNEGNVDKTMKAQIGRASGREREKIEVDEHRSRKTNSRHVDESHRETHRTI